jgi:hypothetical protein
VQDAQDDDLLVFLIHGIHNHERSARNREFPEAVSMIPCRNATETRILPKSIDCGDNAGGDPEGGRGLFACNVTALYTKFASSTQRPRDPPKSRYRAPR